VQLILAEAQLLRDAKQEKEAFGVVDQALDKLPNNPDLLYDHAMLAEKLDRVDILESSLRKLIRIKPDHAHAYNALGYTLADRNQRLEEAQELIVQALKLSPDDAFIMDSMGWVLFRQGKGEEGLKYLQRAYSIRPDAEIAAHLGEVLWALGRRDEARKVWDEALKKTPDNDVLTKTVQRLGK
jgi:tetratricopeptide (TPR) repeat protein